MLRQGWQYSLTAAMFCGLMAGCQSASPGIPVRAQLFAAGATRPSAVSIQRLPPVEDSAPLVVLAAAEQPDELPSPDATGIAPKMPEGIPGGGPLLLNDVIFSVQETYPELIAAILERGIADGNSLAAWGEFDLRVKAFGIAAPEGFYQTYRNGILVDQPLFQGGNVYGGYKIGDGNFQPWFGERETDEGGEFSAGFGLPLLKDRVIDKRRAAVLQADLARRAVEPAVQAQLLEFVRVASQIYWSWVAAGQNLVAQRELLRNAQVRVRQIEEKVKAGDLARIARINNEQLIAARETKVIEAERKLQESAIKLSLFFRGNEGEPIIPDEHRLPTSFPGPSPPNIDQVENDIATAIAVSPVLTELDLRAQQFRVDLQTAENMLLPKLDARLHASKDVGALASSKGDKRPFELETGLYGEIPFQRREARGKITAIEAKLAQIATKRAFVVNKITAAVQDAVSALRAAAGRIERAETNLRLASETLELGRLQFDAGDIDLVTLNIYEKSVTDAQLILISSQFEFFSAVANYRAALSKDPL